MSVGDSAEDFMLIHALGRETLPALPCGLPSNLLKIMFFSLWGAIESLRLCSLNVCDTPDTKCTFNPSLSGRRPLHITGRCVSIACQGWVGAPQQLGTLRFHDAVVDFVERSV